MTDYTPTTDEVRGDYAHFQVPGGTGPVTGEFTEGLAEFDRWLKEHDAEVERAAAARALDLAADEIFVQHLEFDAGRRMAFHRGADAVYDALRARAAEIREGK